MRRRQLFSLLCFSLRRMCADLILLHRSCFLHPPDRRGLRPRCYTLIIFVNFNINFNLRFRVRPFCFYLLFYFSFICLMCIGSRLQNSTILVQCILIYDFVSVHLVFISCFSFVYYYVSSALDRGCKPRPSCVLYFLKKLLSNCFSCTLCILLSQDKILILYAT